MSAAPGQERELFSAAAPAISPAAKPALQPNYLADSTCLSTAADLALFSGPGTISLPCTVANISTHNGANSWSIGFQALAIVKVTYTYTQCITPVRPTTWGRVKSLYR